MAITYRTAGAWGAGKGGNLDAAEIDANFYELAQAIVALDAGPQPAEIDTITVTGNQMTITLTDLTVFGPYTLPRATFTWRDDWVAATAYYANDIVRVGARLYLVAYDHTSESTFDAAFQLSGETSVAYILMASADGFETLSGLTDVEIGSGGPADGDLLVFDGSSGVAKWVNQAAAAATIAVEDDGTSIVGAATTLDFTGAGVSVTDTGGGQATVNIPGLSADLNDLGDVVITTPSDGQVLTYDSVTSQWVNDTIAGGGATTLDGLTDVQIGSGGPADGDFLVFDGSSGVAKWVNQAAGTASIAVEDDGTSIVASATTLDFTGSGVTVTDTGGGQATVNIPGLSADLNDLGDVVITSPSDGQVLTYDSVSGNWLNDTIAGGGASTLDGLTDVEISSGGPADGDFLVFDGSSGVAKWVNQAAGTASIAVEDDGTSVVGAATTLDFTGAGVTVTDTGAGQATVNIPGGAVNFATVTLSGSSTDWSIPAGTKYIYLTCADGAVSGTVSNPKIALLKASDSSEANFDTMNYSGVTVTATPQKSLTHVDTTGTRIAIISMSAAGAIGFDATIYAPRSASTKTFGDARIIADTDPVVRSNQFSAVTAEDHDTIRFTGATTMSGTVHIAYY